MTIFASFLGDDSNFFLSFSSDLVGCCWIPVPFLPPVSSMLQVVRFSFRIDLLIDRFTFNAHSVFVKLSNQSDESYD